MYNGTLLPERVCHVVLPYGRVVLFNSQNDRTCLDCPSRGVVVCNNPQRRSNPCYNELLREPYHALTNVLLGHGQRVVKPSIDKVEKSI